jgi:hypothetical protein
MKILMDGLYAPEEFRDITDDIEDALEELTLEESNLDGWRFLTGTVRVIVEYIEEEGEEV